MNLHPSRLPRLPLLPSLPLSCLSCRTSDCRLLRAQCQPRALYTTHTASILASGALQELLPVQNPPAQKTLPELTLSLQHTTEHARSGAWRGRAQISNVARGLLTQPPLPCACSASQPTGVGVRQSLWGVPWGSPAEWGGSNKATLPRHCCTAAAPPTCERERTAPSLC